MEKINHLELYDIYTTAHIPFWQTGWFLTVLGIICLLMLLGLGYVLFRWYQAKRKTAPAAWQHALTQLHALQQKQYRNKAEGKACYFRMTEILKQYLHLQHQLNTIGKTDEELVTYLQQVPLMTKPILHHLKTICDGCLYIKFADEIAVQRQIAEHIHLSIQIVRETIPHEPTSS